MLAAARRFAEENLSFDRFQRWIAQVIEGLVQLINRVEQAFWPAQVARCCGTTVEGSLGDITHLS